jgi:hypothetical protein
MTRVTQLTETELQQVVEVQGKAIRAAQVADNALKEARLAELEFKVHMQQLFLEKHLDANCAIKWPDDVPAEASKNEQPVEKPVVEKVEKVETPELSQTSEETK